MLDRRSRLATGLALAIGVIALTGCSRSDGEVGAGADWPNHGGGVDESGYSRLTQIDRGNVEKLGLVSSLDLPGEQALEATPLAVDGTLYVTGTYSTVYAVDPVRGTLLWKYDPQVAKHSPDKLKCGFGANRGVAYADGRIFVGVLDGRLVALNAKTGAPAWSVETLPPKTCQAITGAPRVFDGKVIIGNGGADGGARGFVTAYDARTGRQAWRFYTAPGSPEENRGDPSMERAAATWTGEYWKVGTGGTVWNGITFDPEFNRIYLGTGNSGPYNPAVRSPGGGDNLYLASIVALDADTGKYVWHYQVNPREAWDYKATMNIITATLDIDGRPRKVLMQSPSNGFFYVLDRETGKLISAEKTGKVTWAERIDLATGRPVEAANIRYETGESVIWPSAFGTHNWQAMSFSPKTGLVYIPYMQLGGRFTVPTPQTPYPTIGAVLADPSDGKGALLAWDPVSQKARWKAPLTAMWNGGTLVTAGDVTFQGTGDGWFSAFDARDGKLLWRRNVGGGVIAAPSSYAVKGKQYVSVLVGWGGGGASWGQVNKVGWKYGAQPRRLLTFALDGKAPMPASAPPDFTVHALDDPALKIAAVDVAKGAALYNMCKLCHGRDLGSTGAPAPDLRESQVALTENGLWSVVHEGALVERGMPRFDNLTRDQIRQLHAYIRDGARKALAEQSEPAPTRN